MNKKHDLRFRVHKKFNGYCGYCGKIISIKEMQIDHMTPIAFKNTLQKLDVNGMPINSINDFDNLMPSCRRCNHYKRDKTIEQFRKLMETLHERLEKIYINNVAKDYGIITIKPFNKIFYFEQLNRKIMKLETNLKTGVELINDERNEQIEKHGRTVKKDVLENDDYQLSRFASVLCLPFTNSFNAKYDIPHNWDKELCVKMLNKTYHERLIIAGALLAAEFDRIKIASIVKSQELNNQP